MKRHGRQPGIRAAALQEGIEFYVSACHDGHDSVRRTDRRVCRECQRLRALRLRAVQKVVAWRERVSLLDAGSKRGIRCVEALAHPRADSGPGRQP
jgi:hypothetical protein